MRFLSFDFVYFAPFDRESELDESHFRPSSLKAYIHKTMLTLSKPMRLRGLENLNRPGHYRILP